MNRRDWGRVVDGAPVRGRVAIVGVGETDMSANSGRDVQAIAAEAIERALADAGLRPQQVDGLMYRGGMPGQFDAAAFHRHFATDHALWVSDNGGAMTWAGTAPRDAAEAIAAGRASVVVNVFATDWATQTKAQTGGPGQYHRDEVMKSSLEVSFGWYPQPVYFATVARRHQHEHGSTAQALGAIAVSARRHANGHPGAVMRGKTLSLDQYLARRPFIDPLRLEDCCLISDGGAAYVMTSVERAADLAQAPVVVEAVSEAVSDRGYYFAQQGNFTATPQVYCAPAAFREAGISARDVDVLAVYDPFTIVALMQIEDMGFCEPGGAADFVLGDRLDFDRGRQRGGLPFNTHGGLLAHAYVLGISHVVELVRQLRGQAANQVADARLAVYGGYSGGTASTLVLSRR